MSLKNKILISKIHFLLVTLLLVTSLFIYLSRNVYAGDADCCTGDQVLISRNCVISSCDTSPSGCGCTFWKCDDGSEFQRPPTGCVMSGRFKYCYLGDGVACTQTCVDCWNRICGDPPCEPIACTCETGCKAGTSTNNTGPYCHNPTSHEPCDDGCGNREDCPSTECWDDETNRTPDTPSSLSFNIGPVRNSLSTRIDLRTLIPLPLGSETATISSSAYSQSGAGAVYYSFRANNQGTLSRDASWVNFSTSPVRSEDLYISETSSNTVSFNPSIISSSLEGLNRVLYPNALGELRSRNITRDRCDEERRISGERYGHYLVNTLPIVNTITRNFGDPNITAGKATGCSTVNYTGREANNPIGYEIVYSDINNNTYRDVEALFVWFVNDTAGVNPPTIRGLSGSGENNGSDANSFGFMIRRENTTWNSMPTVGGQIGNTGGAWDTSQIYVSTRDADGLNMVKVSNNTILGPNGRQMVRIQNISLQESGDNRLTLTFRAEFLASDDNSVDMVADGRYRVRAGANDHHSFLPVGGQTLRRQPNWDNRNITWNIDLTRPEVSIGDISIETARTFGFDVDVTDQTSGFRRVVGDAYRTAVDSFSINSTIDKVSPSPARTGYLNENGVPVLVGVLDHSQQQYNSISPTQALWHTDADPSQRIVIDIGDNEGGGFRFYATAYDNACNYSVDQMFNGSTSIDDIGEPWLMTKGGSFFSGGGANIPVKEFAPNTSFSFRGLESFDARFGFVRSQTQMATEFLGIGNLVLNNVINRVALAEPSIFRITEYSDNVNMKNEWFNRLEKDHIRTRIKRPSNFTVIENTNMFRDFASRSEISNVSSLSPSAESIVAFYEGNDLVISSNFVCDKKTLVMVDGNLIIHPNIRRGGTDVLNGCLFIVNGSITVTGGQHVSGASADPHYDLLEGLFLAENMIDILEADIDPSINARDGLKIHGSIYGMGSDGGTGIRPGRTLKLRDNMEYPAQVVHYDPRYLELVKFFFGGINYTYIRETGWKP